MITKVIFDMDGLIFDSERLFMHELGEVMIPFGYTMKEENYVQTLGLTGDTLMTKTKSLYGENYPHKKLSRLARIRVNTIAEKNGLPIKKGIKPLLSYLKKSGITCVVASSTHKEFVEKYLIASGLREYFDTVIGGDMVKCSKPEPDIFLAALGNTKVEEAIILEDSTNGILAAHKAKIPVICIPDMITPTDEIKKLTCAVLTDATEVIEIIKKEGMREMKLDNIEPKAVIKYFKELCSIPHGSRNTKQIAEYCVDFAKKHNLSFSCDEHNNVIIKKPATSDCKSDKTVIIQGHLDMVCAAESGYDIDFSTQGIKLCVDEKYIYADKTTLGGDDGIAVAMALAVLSSNDITHPNLECVFTTDEEIGMLGASALNTDSLEGDYLLNIDSEDEGIFTTSCAGGATVAAELTADQIDTHYSHAVKITVDGLIGGHSGVEINKGRQNACIILGKALLKVAEAADISVISINGGEKDNAIPRSAEAIIATNNTDVVISTVKEIDLLYKEKYKAIDANLNIIALETECSLLPIGNKIITFLNTVPNGVIKMSANIDNLVQTSLNLGILRTDSNHITSTFSVRSSVSDEKENLIAELIEICGKLNGKTTVSGTYPAWEYKKNSNLRDTCIEVYKEQYGTEPKIDAIHAGLECGIFSGKLPNIDCISFGPNILDIHTPNEKLDIESTERVYKFLLELLRRL